MKYLELAAQARELANQVRAGGRGGLLIAELEPTITLGLRADPTRELTLSEEDLSLKGVSVIRTDRGGFATYHGPGQWVVYAIDTLERLTGDSRGIRKAVEGYLELASRVAGQCGVLTETIREGDRVGVWSQGFKLASVGVRLEQGVLMHGMALNVYRTGPSFMGIRVCGLNDALPGYLFSGLGPELQADEASLQMAKVRALIEAEARSIFRANPLDPT